MSDLAQQLAALPPEILSAVAVVGNVVEALERIGQDEASEALLAALVTITDALLKGISDGCPPE